MTWTPIIVRSVSVPMGRETAVRFENAADPTLTFQQCFLHADDAGLKQQVADRLAAADAPASAWSVGTVLDLTDPRVDLPVDRGGVVVVDPPVDQTLDDPAAIAFLDAYDRWIRLDRARPIIGDAVPDAALATARKLFDPRFVERLS